jgi:predicted nuclease of predicted toxin-antitoxin system
MRVLIDECLPAGLKDSLVALVYEAETVRRAGYGAKKNGELLSLMDGRWDVLLTNDRNIQYQQNMTGRNVSILILCAKSNRIKDLLPLIPACADALLSISPGRIVEVGSL